MLPCYTKWGIYLCVILIDYIQLHILQTLGYYDMYDVCCLYFQMTEIENIYSWQWSRKRQKKATILFNTFEIKSTQGSRHHDNDVGHLWGDVSGGGGGGEWWGGVCGRGLWSPRELGPPPRRGAESWVQQSWPVSEKQPAGSERVWQREQKDMVRTTCTSIHCRQ